MTSLGCLTAGQLNKAALQQFFCQPASQDMISFLALAAQNVITCDMLTYGNQQRPHPTFLGTPESESSLTDDEGLPTMEQFITKLFFSSNIQVSTLMSTLIYMDRLKSRLQRQARGIRSTAHRIFLASLIVAAKYLNDSSPKNKNWADYTTITTNHSQFSFNCDEVNTMELQLLFLLEWELGVSEENLYHELDLFLEPLKRKIARRHLGNMREHERRRHQMPASLHGKLIFQSSGRLSPTNGSAKCV